MTMIREASLLDQQDLYSDVLSIKEAAKALNVSERSVYGYINGGKLPRVYRRGFLVVPATALHGWERRPPGRARTTIPPWRVPPETNALAMTTITVRLRPGQSQALEDHLSAFRASGKHLFPGTASRAVIRNQHDPDEMLLVLAWRSSVMPLTEERKAAFAALRADLAGVLDWETAVIKEGQALLHA